MNDPTQQGSIVANHMLQVFQDRQGFIWVGSEGYGVDYFNPDKNFFNIIASSTMSIPGLTSNWGRTAVEDNQGGLWLGWVGGLIRMGADGKSIRLWQNIKDKTPQLHYNSIRSLICDDRGDVWIGTTGGINRFHPTTGKMDYLDEKDSLPQGFYWVLMQDSRKNIWIGERSNLYYFDAAEKKIHSAAYHPVLSRLKNKGVRSIREDSRHRIWFGMNGSGVSMYDPDKNELRQWTRTDGNDSTIIGNYTTSITEDKKGIIWIGSFIGMVAYDSQKDKFTQYTRQNGLASNKTSNLMVDDRNRLWIGSTSGLLLLDSSRSHFKNFDLHDGLPTMEFNDQDAYKMKDGRFVFPSMKGFVVFDANAYEENIKIPALYLSSIKVHNTEVAVTSNYEETKNLKLGHDENFFSIELTALNYTNPQQTLYAYKLDPFDKEWIYTKERIANYTNVPGGHYLFHYKATNNPNNWDVPEKILSISIGTVVYKTIWFWTLVGLAILSMLYGLYRIRINQQERIYSLQNKTHALEKEKALVMYESLKQQLNPHFLFNSMTSLSSLIRTNQKLAGEFLDGLSKSYRYILKSRNNEIVPLGNEIKFAEIYIKLQQTRFDKGLIINIDVNEDFYDQKIAPVTLQHLLENAIKHNIIDVDTPLRIDILVEDGYLIVRNNLQRKNFVETSNKQGLINLQSLYHYLSARPLEIREDEKFFTVKIPLI
jgi:sugar lactone lactonase YvrE